MPGLGHEFQILRQHERGGDGGFEVGRGFGREPDLLLRNLDRFDRQPRFYERFGDGVGESFKALLKSEFGIDLQQKIHAAAQIEPERDGRRAEFGEPWRGVAGAVIGDDIAVAEIARQQRAGGDLLFFGGEFNLDSPRRAAPEEARRGGGDAGFGEGFFGLAQCRGFVQPPFGRADLHDRRIGKQRRRGVKKARRHDRRRERVLPSGESIHRRFARKRKKPSAARADLEIFNRAFGQ